MLLSLLARPRGAIGLSIGLEQFHKVPRRIFQKDLLAAYALKDRVSEAASFLPKLCNGPIQVRLGFAAPCDQRSSMRAVTKRVSGIIEGVRAAAVVFARWLLAARSMRARKSMTAPEARIMKRTRHLRRRAILIGECCRFHPQLKRLRLGQEW